MRPLWNSIRSFWVPDKALDPGTRRALRTDKTVTATAILATIAATYGLGVCIANLIGIAT